MLLLDLQNSFVSWIAHTFSDFNTFVIQPAAVKLEVAVLVSALRVIAVSMEVALYSIFQ